MADWTETYRPTTLSAVRGNDKARDQLKEWADTWEDHREAVVVHGSPGVGKTSAAHALAADKGWDVVELNASDQRTKDDIERYAGRAAMNATLSGESAGRQLIILDEADDISGTADRGGTRAITELVKEANQPIVLIANEFYDMSRGLRNACQEIEFRDISKRSILPVIRDICRRENIEYEDEALDALAEKNAGDLRGAINDLQALCRGETTLSVDDVVTGDRDRTEGIFSFLDVVFKEADAEGALRASYDVDETPDDLIAWLEDNVPKDYEGPELARAYGFLADADKWLGRVRATQNYSYWRYAGAVMTAGVAAAREGSKGGWTRYGPPSYWRKLGSSRGTRDTRDDVARAIAATSGASMGTVRREMLPFLARMTHHCKDRELTVAMTAAYDLDADHVSYVTGSGVDTNKVQGIVEDARELQEERMEARSGGAFAGSSASEDENGAADDAIDAPDDTDGAADRDGDDAGDGGAGEDGSPEAQSGLTDFM